MTIQNMLPAVDLLLRDRIIKHQGYFEIILYISIWLKYLHLTDYYGAIPNAPNSLQFSENKELGCQVRHLPGKRRVEE